ncbi:hypothetical protein KSP40_PGU009110 [Platanthera guangdongensis]|uniref:Uncharacterized protein n=1 Tax=Platanthera guangdongensis TaxID=2320717 RepID=A0ABR2MKS0_9ASPA
MEGGGAAVRASYQSVLVALLAPPPSPFGFQEHLPAAVAVPARHEPDAAAAAAHERGILPGNPLEQIPQFAGFVEVAHLVRSADMAAADKNLRQGHRLHFSANQPLELAPVGCVHGDVPLVNGDAEAAEDGANSAAVRVRPADAAKGGGVDDDSRIGPGNIGAVVGGVLP